MLMHQHQCTNTNAPILFQAVKTKVKDNTVTVLDSGKLLKEVEALP